MGGEGHLAYQAHVVPLSYALIPHELKLLMGLRRKAHL